MEPAAQKLLMCELFSEFTQPCSSCTKTCCGNCTEI